MFTRSVIAKVQVLAKELNVEAADLLAVAEVESAGVTSWPCKNGPMPPIRFEGHYFYRLLSGAKRAKAIKAGLASPKAGAVANPKNYQARYDMLARAKAIDPAAAIQSTSYGLGQVMGDHYKKLGFATPQALEALAVSGVDGQIDLMARYIRKFGLVDEIQGHKDASFAIQYNGPAAAKGNYAGKISKARARYIAFLNAGATGPVENEDAGAKQIQMDLKKLGYYAGPTNGKYGPMTKAAVKKFQMEHGLIPDGKYGKMTDEAVDEEMLKLRRNSNDNAVLVGGSTTGAGTATEVIHQATDQLQMVSYMSDILTWVVVVLVVVGLGITGYGLYKNYKLKQEAS